MADWRILVVEDDAAIAAEVKEALEAAGWLDGSSFTVEVTTSFDEALHALERFRFDILILDLRAESAKGKQDEADAGLKVLERIKAVRFAPVIFYTALPNVVRGLASPFVRIVEKTEGVMAVRAAVAAVLSTKLPYLNRYLEDQQRRYMWDFVESTQELASPQHNVDLAFLMARRLAAALRVDFARLVATEVAGVEAAPKTDKVHPVEFYIMPPVGECLMAGDLLKAPDGADYSIVLTPSCDVAQGNADFVLLASCVPLTTRDEYKKWAASDKPGVDVTESLERLLGDRGKERYRFLPGTMKFPDLMVDLQQLQAVPKSEFEGRFTRVASLDSPYAEKLLATFARYYGRIGTPDLDIAITIERLRSQIPPQKDIIDGSS